MPPAAPVPGPWRAWIGAGRRALPQAGIAAAGAPVRPPAACGRPGRREPGRFRCPHPAKPASIRISPQSAGRGFGSGDPRNDPYHRVSDRAGHRSRPVRAGGVGASLAPSSLRERRNQSQDDHRVRHLEQHAALQGLEPGDGPRPGRQARAVRPGRRRRRPRGLQQRHPEVRRQGQLDDHRKRAGREGRHRGRQPVAGPTRRSPSPSSRPARTAATSRSPRPTTSITAGTCSAASPGCTPRAASATTSSSAWAA